MLLSEKHTWVLLPCGCSPSLTYPTLSLRWHFQAPPVDLFSRFLRLEQAATLKRHPKRRPGTCLTKTKESLLQPLYQPLGPAGLAWSAFSGTLFQLNRPPCYYPVFPPKSQTQADADLLSVRIEGSRVRSFVTLAEESRHTMGSLLGAHFETVPSRRA